MNLVLNTTAMRGRLPLYFACFFFAVFVQARAHVALDSPNGGESYRPGQKVQIMWHPVVDHSTMGWALEYSLSGPNGPWIAIDLSIPAGNTAAGFQHTYLWTVPQLTAAAVWVRVQQLNPGTNYDDVSSSPFEIKDALSGNTTTFSISAGGSHVLNIDAGSLLGGEIFTILGNFSGTNPGIPYQGFVIPLNQDFYFDQTLLLPNFAPLSNSLGFLDSAGMAQTTFSLPPAALDPGVAGVVLNHAAVVVDSSFAVQIVSNPVSFTLIP